MPKVKKNYKPEIQEMITFNRKKVGVQIKFYRDKVYKMSRKELADRSGVSESFIQYIENGSSAVTLDKLILVCSVMNIQIKLTL